MKTRKCIVCSAPLKKDAMPGSDDWFFCPEHRDAHRAKMIRQSKADIRGIAKALFTENS